MPAPTVPATVPSGAGVGPGQLLVEGTAAGATAIAALTWILADAESTPSLVLPVAAGSTVTIDSVILACKAAAQWSPPPSRPGTWESKPITDGQSCINGVVAADGSSVGFGLQPLLRKTVLDIVLVAGTDLRLPDGADGSTFRFVFDDPAAGSLKVVTRSAPSTDIGSESGGSPSGSVRGDDPVFDASGSPRLAPSLPDLRAPDSSGAATPALDPQDLGPSVPRLVTPVLAAMDSDDATARPLAIVFLLGGATLAFWSSQERTPRAALETATVGLGPFRRPAALDTNATVPSEPEVRGLAGFARPRTQPPVPL